MSVSYATGYHYGSGDGAVSVSFSDGAQDDFDWPVSITNSRVEHVGAYYSSAAIYVAGAGPVTVTDTVVADSESAGIQVSVSELIGGSVNVSRNTVDGAAGNGISASVSAQSGLTSLTVRDNLVRNVQSRAYSVVGDRLVGANLTGNAGTNNIQNVFGLSGTLAGTMTIPITNTIPVLLEGTLNVSRQPYSHHSAQRGHKGRGRRQAGRRWLPQRARYFHTAHHPDFLQGRLDRRRQQRRLGALYTFTWRLGRYRCPDRWNRVADRDRDPLCQQRTRQQRRGSATYRGVIQNSLGYGVYCASGTCDARGVDWGDSEWTRAVRDGRSRHRKRADHPLGRSEQVAAKYFGGGAGAGSSSPGSSGSSTNYWRRLGEVTPLTWCPGTSLSA